MERLNYDDKKRQWFEFIPFFPFHGIFSPFIIIFLLVLELCVCLCVCFEC